jgi:hypothetical protein
MGILDLGQMQHWFGFGKAHMGDIEIGRKPKT